MKRKIWISHLIAALLSTLLSAGTVGCLVSGFDLNVESMGMLMVQCVLFSAGCALCFRFRGGSLLITCLVAVAAGFLWRTGNWFEQLQSLLLNITSRYNSAYSCGVLFPNAPGGANSPVDNPLVTLIWLVSTSAAWTVSRRKSALFALPPVLIPLIVCLVVTDTVPDTIYLYLLMLGVALLLLTDFSRRKGILQGNRMMTLSAIPVAAALAILFLLVPQKSYVDHFEDYQDQMLIWFQKLQSLAEETSENLSISTSGNSQPERLDLSTVGPKVQWDYTVMEVTAPVDGTLYLRGRDYNTYGGSGWVASKHRTETFSQGTESLGTLTIRTLNIRDILYIPYYPAEEVTLLSGAMSNPDNLTEYSFELADDPQFSYMASYESLAFEDLLLSSAAPDTQYRQLPASTMLWATPLAKEITEDCTTTAESAQAIGNYVRNSASYNLDTPRMNGSSDDFAQWFLEESDTGYCVHFATAATVLLRAMNIPARYVEGYLVACRAGETVDVSSKQAHAWAEYYDSARNTWVILEATPADLNEPEQTEPPATAAETEAVVTAPEEVTEPDIPQTQLPTQAAPAPDETAGTPQERKQLSGGIKLLLALILAILAIWGQSELRIQRKRALWRKGPSNARALARYAQLCRMYKLLKRELPEPVEALAQKARFSQHTLTKEELEVFDVCRRDGEVALKALSPGRRMVIRFLFAVS